MSSATLERAARGDWIFANPWPWAMLGLCLCVVGWMMVLALGELLEELRVTLVFLGLLAAGAGVTLRLSSARPSYVGPSAPGVRHLVALLFALIASALTILLVLRFFDINPLEWRLNGLIILWIVACPLSLAAMAACSARIARKSAVSPAEEGAAILALAALTAFCGCRALYNSASPQDWDTMRLFLHVVFVVAIVAAPLIVVSQTLRRVIVSVLILLHFGGMCMAALAAPPSPWLVMQIWQRIYQPYLEFMYLNNAYHFYAPEPGPASFLWFRMFYEDSQGQLWGHWVNIPDLDERGWHQNTLALEYQRMLAVTENVVPSVPLPNMYVSGPGGGAVFAYWYSDRLEHTPNHMLVPPAPVLGQEAPKAPEPAQEPSPLVPFPLYIPLHQQYLQPTDSSLALLSSYARHVCLTKHPTHPDWQIKYVKMYRVVHMIPAIAAFVNERVDPRDPENYRPYYMGKYDPQGKLLDLNEFNAKGKLIRHGDPFLFWLLPNLRDQPTHLVKSPIKSWVRKHAGDPDWIYVYDETEKRHLLVQHKD